MKKMKVVDKFAGIKAMLNGEKVEGFTLADAMAFLDERISITEKKNASGSNADRKPTKEQLANEGIKQEILNFLATQTAPVPMGEIMKAVGIESNQKVTALVSSMLTIRKGEVNPDGKVVRSEVKGKAHFALATEE
jgi:hypothetical protein